MTEKIAIGNGLRLFKCMNSKAESRRDSRGGHQRQSKPEEVGPAVPSGAAGPAPLIL